MLSVIEYKLKRLTNNKINPPPSTLQVVKTYSSPTFKRPKTLTLARTPKYETR